MATRESRKKKPRRERGSLTAEDIIESAFDLAEETSLDRLSIPLIGKRLNVGPTSVSWYFHRKDDLLDTMADQALQRYMPAAAVERSPDWRATLSDHARRIRATFLANSVLCDLILLRSAPAQLATHFRAEGMNRAVLSLIEAGLPIDDALDVHSAICLHVHGTVVLQRLHDKNRQRGSDAGAYYDKISFDSQHTPVLHAAMSGGRKPGTPDDRSFEYGLDCILAHATRLLDTYCSKVPAAETPESPETVDPSGASETVERKSRGVATRSHRRRDTESSIKP